jgi:hypothetical protein
MTRLFLEPLLGSIGILLAGFLTIPLAAYFVGATVSAEQGFEMGLIFFVARFAWLSLLRLIFSRLFKHATN